ncbi:MAG: response regulator [SAR324 cluster bacterium]|nr:response regulator [SAR324 cluster bacterium]
MLAEERAYHLRKQAEDKLEEQSLEINELSLDEIADMVHELRVHQAELEIQNDELRLMQEELERSRDSYLELYHQAPNGYMTVNNAGVIIQANQTLASMLELDFSELKGKAVVDFLDSEFQDMFRVRFTAFFKNPEGKNIEVRLIRSELGPLFVNLRGRSLKNSSLLLMTISDVDQRKKAEQNAMLAQKEAEAANQAKSLFLANMSHEIRTPLHAISGFGQILQHKSKDLNLPEYFQQYLQNIKISTEMLSKLVEDILDFSKIESGKLELHQENFRLRELIEDIYSVHVFEAGKQGVLFSYEISAEIPLVIQTDRGKLVQILSNLIGNAIKFTPEDKEVKLKVMGDQNSLAFMVIDKGIGIPKERQKSIFNAFEQVDGSTTRQYGGTGLGLSISKKLAKLLGGKIVLASQVGVGSTFNLILPLSKMVSALPAFSRMEKTDETITIGRQSTGFSGVDYAADNVILVVEDNEMNRTLVEVMLDELGLHVEFAEDGENGLQKALELATQPKGLDLILMDMHLPDMNGSEITEKILKNPACHDIPVVALSADVMTEQLERAKAVGIRDYLGKPIDVDQLRKVFDKYLRKK